MKHTKIFAALVCIITITGCGDQEEWKPFQERQGFMNGTIIGPRLDGTEINETFNYTNLAYANLYYTDSATQNIHFSIQRVDPDNADYCRFTIVFDIPKDSIAPRFIWAHIGYNKGTDPSLQFSLTNYPATIYNDKKSFAFSNFSFDPSTGRVKMNYNFSNKNFKGRDATVTGEIDVLAEDMYKKRKK